MGLGSFFSNVGTGGLSGVAEGLGFGFQDSAFAGSDALFGTNFYGTKQQIGFGRETNALNYRMAQEQMNFQERMSNSAYQRQVEDMKKAGLNPMLAIMKGGGASTPTGSSANQVNPAQGAKVGSNSAVSNMLGLLSMKKQLQQMDATRNNTVASTAASINQADLARKQAKIAEIQGNIAAKTANSAIKSEIMKNERESTTDELLQKTVLPDYIFNKMKDVLGIGATGFGIYKGSKMINKFNQGGFTVPKGSDYWEKTLRRKK